MSVPKLTIDEAIEQLISRQAKTEVQTGPVPGEDVTPKKNVPPADPEDPSGEALASDAGSRTDAPAVTEEDEQGTTEGSPEKKTVEDDPEQDPDGPNVNAGADSSDREDSTTATDVTRNASTVLRGLGNIRKLLKHQASVELVAHRYMKRRAEVAEEAVKEKKEDVKSKLKVSDEEAEKIAREVIDGDVDEAEVTKVAEAVKGLSEVSKEMEQPPAEVARVASVIGTAGMQGNAQEIVRNMRSYILQHRTASAEKVMRERYTSAKSALAKAKKSGDEFDLLKAKRHMASVNDQINRLFGHTAREDTGNMIGTTPEMTDEEEDEARSSDAEAAAAAESPAESADVAAEQASSAEEEQEDVVAGEEPVEQDPEELAAVLLADEAGDDEVTKAAEVVKKLQGGIAPEAVTEAIMERSAGTALNIEDMQTRAAQDVMNVTPKEFVHLYLDAHGYPAVTRKEG